MATARRAGTRQASRAAIATLGLGIGFSTVAFSLVNFLLLRPLPISDPESAVSFHTGQTPAFSFPNYLDIREANDVFTDLAALRVLPRTTKAGVPRRVVSSRGSGRRALSPVPAANGITVADSDGRL